MAEKVNFKLGGSEKFDTIESKEQGTLYAVNEAFAETPGDSKQGSIYLGDKLLGTSKASELRTVNPITVTEGSPIDAMGLFPDNIIPAGTTVEDLFKRLVSVEIYPTTTIAANGSFTVTLGAPSISASVSNKAVVEAGSEVTFTSIKSGSDSISTVAAKVSGFTYGYKDSLEGDKVDVKEITSDWSSTPSGEYLLNATVEGFSALGTSSVSAGEAADAKIENQTVTVAKGSNKLTVKGTGKSYQATREAIAPKFIISNANGVSEEHKSQEIAGVSQSYTDANGNLATFEVTGIYPAYYGVVSSDSPTEEAIKGMTKLVKTKQALVVSGPFNNAYMCVACPPGWTVAKAVDSNGFDNTSSMVSKTVNVVCLDGTTQTYNVYLIGPSTQGDAFTMTFN